MDKINFDNALCVKVLESFKESEKDIMRGLAQLEKNHQEGEYLDLDTREKIMDAGYVLEAAVYRSIAYHMDTRKTMQPELQKLNTAVNTLAMKTNNEFLITFNLKIVALISLYIVYNI